MALLAGELAQVVWAETKLFGLGRADGTGDVNEARRLVAGLAASTQGAGFAKREVLPQDPAYKDTGDGIMSVVVAAKDMQPPQRRLIVWPASGDAAHPVLANQPPPPSPWNSARDVKHEVRLTLPNGRVVDVFSRAPLADDQDGAPFVNALTGTGVPGADLPLPRPAAPAPAAPPKPYRKTAWTLGIVGILLLVFGGAISAWSGRSMAGARNLLATNSTPLQKQLLKQVQQFCREELKDLPGGPQATGCKSFLFPGDNIPEAQISSLLSTVKECAQDVNKSACPTIWRAAVEVDQNQTWKSSFFYVFNSLAWYFTGPSTSAGSGSIIVPFLVVVLGIALLVIGLGLGTKQRVAGVWIDTRNRVSLARAQVTLWTIVALAGYAAFLMFNVGMGSILDAPGDFSLYHAFPSIPTSVAAALGIAAGSPMLSALILPTKDKGQPDFAIRGADSDLSKRGTPFFGAASDGLDKRESPAQASLADIFMGEEKANADTVDVARLQNVVITVLLVLGFFSLLVDMTSIITPEAIMKASKTAPVFPSLPDPGATFASLLFVSHATYLVSKAHDAQSPRPEGGGSQ